MCVRAVGPDDARYVEVLRHVRPLLFQHTMATEMAGGLSRRVRAGLRQAAKSGHQCCQTGAVFLSQRGQF
jgi:hypothetical protein